MSSEEAAKTPTGTQGVGSDDEFLKIAGRNTGLGKQSPYTIQTSIPYLPTAPKMGGIAQVDSDKQVAWTGGKPNPYWTGLDDTALKTPTKPTQYRSNGTADVKSYTYRTTGLKSKFDKSSDLETFCTSVWEHLEECGMDSITYLPDPANNNKMTSVVTNHGRFNQNYTLTESKKLKTEAWDEYDKSNDLNAKLYLFNSLKPALKKSIQQVTKPEDTFAIIWIRIMRKKHQNSREYFRKLEETIKSLDPLTYPGQHMDEWCTDVRTHVNILVNSGQYDHKLSEHIIEAAMTAGGDNNEDWKAKLRPTQDKLEEKLDEVGLFSTRTEANLTMAEADLTPIDILDKIEDTYIALLNKDRWLPAKNPVDSAAPPSRFRQNKAYLCLHWTEQGISCTNYQSASKWIFQYQL